MVTLRKTAMVLAVACFFTALGLNTWMEFSYSASMPAAPDPATGRTLAIEVNHNRRVYVTASEYGAKRNAERFFFVGGGLCIALIAFLKLYYRVF